MKTVETIEVNFGDIMKNYVIDIGENIQHRLITFISENCKSQRVLIISDERVASYYLEDLQNALDKISLETFSYIIKPGETSKSLEVASNIYSVLAMHAFSRSDLIIALGGGVVGDLAGYVAATFKRGLSFIQVPTTLLAQVDSSVGGKVAINIAEGKNLVGAFYQPLYVLIDTSYLTTLQKDQWQDGLGEIIKYAFIGSEELYEILGNHTIESIKGEINDVIAECCRIKRDVVIKDEFDTGLRMTLNFGHTLGHAIEKYYGYGTYSHGQAVAMGMYLIMRQFESRELLNNEISVQIKKMLKRYDLFKDEMVKTYPYYCKDILNDKKVMSGKINIIIVDKVGDSRTYPLNLSQAEKLLSITIG